MPLPNRVPDRSSSLHAIYNITQQITTGNTESMIYNLLCVDNEHLLPTQNNAKASVNHDYATQRIKKSVHHKDNCWI